MEKREEMFVNKTGSFGTAMTIVDTNVGSTRRGEDLALIFKTIVSLHDGDGEIAGSVGFKVSVPHESISTGSNAKTTFERPGKGP